MQTLLPAGARWEKVVGDLRFGEGRAWLRTGVRGQGRPPGT